MTEQNRKQDEIAELLKTDPQAATVRMVEAYTGLLWKIAEQYLQDPEDIKECVNDTFLEFYTHQDRFDPAKGTLRAYLAVIARNVSVSRYRKNRSRNAELLTEDIPDELDEIQNMDEKLDIEKALSTLKPEDAELIRMRYYGGMTLQEIAESMHLPYETVKKRHQRSLAKMRLALIAGMILLFALLAACAYTAARYFGIIPGMGLVNPHTGPVYEIKDKVLVEDETGSHTLPVYEPKENASAEKDAGIDMDSVYELKEKVSIENETGIFTIESGYLVENKAVLQGTVHHTSEDSSTWITGTPAVVIFLQYEGIDYPCPASWSAEGVDASFNCTSGQMELPAEKAERLEMTFCLADVEIPLVFCPGTLRGIEDYSHAMGEKGGLMADPHWENGEFMVDIYPIGVEGYTFTHELVASMITLEEYPTDIITLRAEDGSERIGRYQVSNSSTALGIIADKATWNFGVVEPGDYTLHVPYVLLEEAVENPPVISVNLAECRWEEGEYQFPGALISVKDCQTVEAVPGELVLETEPIAEYAREGFSYWLLTLQYRQAAEEDGDVSVLPCFLTQECPELTEILDGEYGSMVVNNEEENYQLLIRVEDGKYDITQFQIKAEDRRILKWNHSFDIPVTAEPEP